jgi:hypothetical protein
VHNAENAHDPGDYRTGHGQTAYKRDLAYQHLGIRPEGIEYFPFLRANLRRIGRHLNRGRTKDAPLLHPFDLLECSEDAEARRLWSVYHKVPITFRKLVRPECFCFAAQVHPMRALELVTAAVVRHGARVSAIPSGLWHPHVVEKTIEMALKDEGIADRNALHRATGFIALPKGSTTIVNVQQNAQAQVPVNCVPLPSPESTIRMLAEAFNEARQTMPPPPVRNMVNVTAQVDEAYDRDEW